MKTKEKIEMLKAACELLHTEGHETVYDSSESTIFWDARTFIIRSISRIKTNAEPHRKDRKG